MINRIQNKRGGEPPSKLDQNQNPSLNSFCKIPSLPDLPPLVNIGGIDFVRSSEVIYLNFDLNRDC